MDRKICHMTSVHKRYDTRIFQHECRSLAAYGYDVCLIVADGKGDEEKNGVKIYDVGTNRVSRIKRMISITKRIEKKALMLDCEVYHFHDPELMFVGLHLASKGKKVIVDMHEDHPSYISEAGYIPMRKCVAFFYEKLEKFAVKRFSGIVSTRQTITDRLSKYNPNIVLITNYPNLLKDAPSAEKTGIADNKDIIIAFAGAVVDSWRHKMIIEAIEDMDDVKYLLAGPVSDEYLSMLKSLKGWNKVQYLGEVPYDTVGEMYKKASIGVAIYVYCKNMGGTEGNLANTKMFEYMNYGLPFICTDFRLWKQIVEEEEKCGICVNPYDQKAIKEAIQYMISHPEERKVMGMNSRKAAEKAYNWENQEKKLVAFYKRVISNE